MHLVIAHVFQTAPKHNKYDGFLCSCAGALVLFLSCRLPSYNLIDMHRTHSSGDPSIGCCRLCNMLLACVIALVIFFVILVILLVIVTR
jgi:hypothetical protein